MADEGGLTGGAAAASPRGSQEGQGALGSPLTPRGATERIGALDALRGVAVLGILAMNIAAYALPFAAYSNPAKLDDPSAADLIAWLVNHVVFEMKMMSIFSMLFGAGIVLMADRALAKGAPLTGVFYRRMGWLLAIGLVHAYLIWHGDILVSYALLGMALYPLRRLSARTLLIGGAIVTLGAVPLSAGMGAATMQQRSEARQAMAARDAGEELTEAQEQAIESWEEERAFFDPTPAQVQEEIDDFRGSYPDVVERRAPLAFSFQTTYLLVWGVWRIGGMMLLGMGLMKLGVFTGEWSARRYWRLLALGYVIGLPIVLYGAWRLHQNQWDFAIAFKIDFQFNYVGSVFVALGHVAVVMLFCRSGALAWLRSALAATGRMALTNYLLQSVIATTLFYGYGFDLFAQLDRIELWGVVGAIWVAQLAWSPWWLDRFRFGPVEWLWRSLTYLKPQPMRRGAE